MSKKLCIHGHFYQPPREDPWFGKIFLEGSAAPMHHWNARITRESYAPLAWARRLDGQGCIAELMNCYEWMSFNIGPTLMLWLERQAPLLLERIIEADKLSQARWGHGNAIAQVFHHSILPLASALDKEVEIEWALADFRHRFGRESEGIWLAECAADIATLEAVAERGIKFVVLSPHQARLVREGGVERAVDASSLNYGTPYNISLPSGRSVAAFFYEATLAQSVAFEGLLSDGEKFWQKIRYVAQGMPGEGGLLTLATDGETYGHHFTFGEMSLAYVLAQGYSGRDGISLTNFGAYLAGHPPVAEAVLHEPSSWSCAHGVERWRSNCGCTTGGHPGWGQEWRTPLREALVFLKKRVDEHFFQAGADLFNNPRAALLEYGAVLVNHEARREFVKKHFSAKASADKQLLAKAWLLLRMQKSALAAQASCAWFFDEISRIEPVNAMRFALLTMEIMGSTGGADIQPDFEAVIARALSNIPAEGSGLDIFKNRVLPSRQDAASLCLFSYLYAFAAGRKLALGQEELVSYPSLSVYLTVTKAEGGKIAGKAVITAPESKDGAAYEWSGRLPHPAAPGFVSFVASELEAQPLGQASPVFKRSGAELAVYLKDYLSISLMKRLQGRQYADSLGAAQQLVSTLHPYEEAQETLNLAQLWRQHAAYLPVALYLTDVPAASLEKVAKIFDDILNDFSSQQMARELLEAAILHDLENGVADEAVAAGIKRVNMVFKRADWWGVQNALWRNGRVRPEYPESAAALGFRL